MKRFIGMIASQVRNIDVMYYKQKIVFQIPLYDDILFKKYKIKVDEYNINITFQDLVVFPPKKVHTPLKTN